MSKVISWVNPPTYVDGTPYGEQDNKGYTIRLDGEGAVSIPLAWGTSFDMEVLDAYKALKRGEHSVALAVVSKEGESSAFTNPVTFPVVVAPMAATDLAVA